MDDTRIIECIEEGNDIARGIRFRLSLILILILLPFLPGIILVGMILMGMIGAGLAGK